MNQQCDAVKQFLAEVVDLCKEHGFSISHEDGHGAFEVERFTEHDAAWLKAALDKTGEK